MKPLELHSSLLLELHACALCHVTAALPTTLVRLRWPPAGSGPHSRAQGASGEPRLQTWGPENNLLWAAGSLGGWFLHVSMVNRVSYIHQIFMCWNPNPPKMMILGEGILRDAKDLKVEPTWLGLVLFKEAPESSLILPLQDAAARRMLSPNQTPDLPLPWSWTSGL